MRSANPVNRRYGSTFVSCSLIPIAKQFDATSTAGDERRTPHSRRPRRGGKGARRHGTAVVETAIMLPIIIVLLFTSIELANGIFLKQAVTIAAYEGARSATRPGGTNSTAENRIDEVLLARSVGTYTVTFSPTVTELTTRGTPITVTVEAAASTYALNPLRLLQDRKMGKSITMVRL